MAINFPTSPSTNDTHTVGTSTWKWDGTSWISVITSEVTPTNVSDTANTSTGAFDVPAGTTAQRPGSPSAGYIRFNTTTSGMEVYSGTGWVGYALSDPSIASVSPATVTVTGTTVTISGSNFKNGATVRLIGNDTTLYTPTATSFVSNSEISFTTPVLTVANEPYDVRVTNPDSGTTTAVDAIDAGGTPTWNTTAGTLGSFAEAQWALSIALSATEPDSQTLTYTVTAGSLPVSTTLSTAGVISGSTSGGDDTTYTFTVGASDGVNVASREFSIEVLGNWKYKQIITKAYTGCGYKDSVPWRSAHRTVVATDQTSNLGDLFHMAANYTSGCCSLTKLFIWGADNTAPGTTTTTTVMHMVNETTQSAASHYNTIYARNDSGTVFKEHEKAWITGGTHAEIDVFNIATESMLTNQNISSGMSGVGAAQDGVAGFSDQNNGYWYGTGTGRKIVFASDTISTTTAYGFHEQQKGMCSKNARGYAGAEGSYSGGNNLNRWNLTTDSNLGTVPKPQTNTGEENFTLGQDHQYMIGCYDDVQSNDSWRFSYVTETGTVNNAGMQPTAHAGQSSGHCGWI